MRFNEFKLTEATYDPVVAKKQEELVKLGYDLGPYGPKGDGVDGITGPYTQAAMDAYEKGIKPEDAPSPSKAAVAAFNSSIGFKPNSSGFGLKPGGSGFGIKLPVNAPVSSPFGHRTSVGAAHNHNGTDFAVPTGTPVRAPQGGVVKAAGTRGGGEGVFVIVDAGDVVHKFFHLSKVMVSAGDKVDAGQVVALSGNTGYSTGPHLHWETHVAGRPVDPMKSVG